VIVQLESMQAMDQLEAIAAVDGVDAIFMGPADLSGAMGHIGKLTHPEVMKRDGRRRPRAARPSASRSAPSAARPRWWRNTAQWATTSSPSRPTSAC
jgi:2-keto-3-deoxy-L-rhamnonate aldolase RhmA